MLKAINIQYQNVCEIFKQSLMQGVFPDDFRAMRSTVTAVLGSTDTWAYDIVKIKPLWERKCISMA